jgi:hypothetical protein
MEDVSALLTRWQISPAHAREQIYRAKPPRERERRHAFWVFSCGWSTAQVAQALERDAHTIGEWFSAFANKGPSALAFEQSGGSPRPPASAASSFEASGRRPARSGWCSARQLDLARRAAVSAGPLWSGPEPEQLPALAASPELYLETKKRRLKAAAQTRHAFGQHDTTWTASAVQSGAKHFFVNEAHFRAKADLRGKWVQRSQPALVDSTRPRLGENVTSYSAVCLESGEVEAFALDGYSSTDLQQLRAKYNDLLVIFGDNSPAHGVDALRAYLANAGSPGCG